MSVRGEDALAVANRASGFSLRDALASMAGGGRATPVAAPQAAPRGFFKFDEALRNTTMATAAVPHVVKAPERLGFKIAQPEQRAPVPNLTNLPRESLTPLAPPPLMSTARSAAPATAPAASPRNFAQAAAATAANAVRRGTTATVSAEYSQADVMRLSAYVEELTQRVQSTQSKLASTERHLSRTSSVLASERHNASAKIQALGRDLVLFKEREERLRTELSNRPPKTTLPDAKFAATVEAALQKNDELVAQTEAHQRTVSELEAKVDALANSKAALEKEISTLEEAHEHAKKLAAEVADSMKADIVKQAEAEAEVAALELAAEKRRLGARELLAKAANLEASANARCVAAAEKGRVVAPCARGTGFFGTNETALNAAFSHSFFRAPATISELDSPLSLLAAEMAATSGGRPPSKSPTPPESKEKSANELLIDAVVADLKENFERNVTLHKPNRHIVGLG